MLSPLLFLCGELRMLLCGQGISAYAILNPQALVGHSAGHESLLYALL